MSTRFIKVGSTREAWDLVRVLVSPVVADLGYSDLHALPGFVKDDSSSARAGYSVYRLEGWDLIDDDATEKLFYNYVSDLGGVLELNTCGADWSGDVYRITVDPSSTPAGSSAVAGATPAEGSDSAAGDPDLVTLRLRRSDVCRVSSALLGVKFEFIEEALPLQVDDPRRGVCIRSARAWDALHKEVRRQLQEHDARRGCGVDPWEVA
ncbi:MAG: hypothetical protein II265_09020 [Clostridia bacterium]|nr:hypothetical protein [Clostridia bacterium]